MSKARELAKVIGADGSLDGRDVSADGEKLDTLEVSQAAGNKLSLEADGLYVPPPQLASAQW